MSKVIFENEDTPNELEVTDDQTLYDACFEQGLDLPHGCLSGSCGACKIIVLEGENSLSPPTLMEKNTLESLISEFKKKGTLPWKESQLRLSCRAKISGDLRFKKPS